MSFFLLQPKTSSSSAAPSQGPSTPSRAAASTPAAPPAPAPATSAPAQTAPPATPSPAATGASQSGSAFNDPSALMTGPENESVVAQMVTMGFAREDITRAMRAAFFNPDRAIEYLLNVSVLRRQASNLCSTNRTIGYPREHPARAAATTSCRLRRCRHLANPPGSFWRERACAGRR